MSRSEPVQIVQERGIPGPAETLAALPDQDEATLAEALAGRLADQGVAVPGDRGLASYVRGLVGRLRARKLVQDHGVHDVQLRWLGFHVPPGGKGRLVLGRSAAGKGGIDLRFMGLGFGSGWEMKTADEQDFGDRTQCFTLGSVVTVHLREFVEGTGSRTVQVDVLESRGTFLENHDDCPLCFAAPAPGPQPRRLESRWDLSGDPLGLTEKRSYDLTATSEVEIGLDLPVLAAGGLTAGVAISRSVQSTCVATYDLKGGGRFSAYRALMPGLDLPFWGKD